MINLKPMFYLNDTNPETLIKHFYSLPSTANTGAEAPHISENLDHTSLKSSTINPTFL